MISFRLRGRVGPAGRAVRGRPPVVTLALVAAIIATFVRLQQGGQLPLLRFVAGAFSIHAITWHRYGVLATSTLLTRDVFMVSSICVSLLVTMGTYEVLAGHLRAAVLAVFGAVAGPLSVAAGVGLLVAAGNHWALGRLDTMDIGASAIVAVCSGAVAGIVRDRRLTVGLVLFLLGGLVVHHQLADWEHVLVFPWGYLAGRVFGQARLGSRRHQAARRGGARRAWPRAAAYAFIAVVLSGGAVAASAAVLPPTPGYRIVAVPAPTGTAAHGPGTPPLSAAGQAPSAGQVPTARVVGPPTLLDSRYPSPALGMDRKVFVVLPAGYDSSGQGYPVVVFLHGHPGTALGLIQAFSYLGSQDASGVAPYIGVFPDGNGPTVQDSWYLDQPRQRMGTSVTVDLRTWVDSTFRTDGSYSYAGLSSGGFGAAYLPLVDSRPVHAVCGLSGWYDGNIPPLKHDGAARQRASASAHVGREPALTFLSYGTSDAVTNAQTDRYAAALRAAGKRVVVTPDPGGHSPGVWRAGLLQCLREIVPAR